MKETVYAVIIQFFPFLFLFFLILLPWILMRLYTGRKWRALAKALQLEYAGPGRLLGLYKGYDIQSTIFQRKGGSSFQEHTLLTLSTTIPMPKGLQVFYKTTAQQVMTRFLTQDIRVGLAHLDNRVVIKGEDEKAVPRIFNDLAEPNRVIQVCKSGSKAGIEQKQFSIELSGRNPDVYSIIDALDLLVSVIQDFEQACRKEYFRSKQ